MPRRRIKTSAELTIQQVTTRLTRLNYASPIEAWSCDEVCSAQELLRLAKLIQKRFDYFNPSLL